MATGHHQHGYLRTADDDHDDDHKDDDDDDDDDDDERLLGPAPQSSPPPRRLRAAAASALFAVAAILVVAFSFSFFFYLSSSPTIGRAFRGGGTSPSSVVRHGDVRVPGASLPPSCAAYSSTRSKLRFRRLALALSNETASSSAAAVATFKILHLTDLHLGEGESEGWGPRDDGRTLDLIRFLLLEEWPVDLVVLGGDQLTANNIDGNATDYHGMLLDVLANFAHPGDEGSGVGGGEGGDDGVGVGWATMFGNHDDTAFVYRNGTERRKARTTRQHLWDFDRSYHQLSYTGQCGVVDTVDEGEGGGDDDVDGGAVFGVSNYFLPLYHLGEEEKDDDEEVARLYVFDSGGGSLEQKIDRTQLDWFRAVNRGWGGDEGNPPQPPPALAFQHIPAGQFRFRSGDECPGMRRDVVTPLRSDAGIVEALLSHGGDNNSGGGNVRVLAVGHDHGSDYCCPYPASSSSTTPTPGAIHLCFNRHSGYGGYDSTAYPGFGGNWTRGGRVYQLELTPEPRPRAEGDGGDGGGGVDKEGGARPDPNSRYRFSWRSWARLADGSRVSEVRGT